MRLGPPRSGTAVGQGSPDADQTAGGFYRRMTLAGLGTAGRTLRVRRGDRPRDSPLGADLDRAANTHSYRSPRSSSLAGGPNQSMIIRFSNRVIRPRPLCGSRARRRIRHAIPERRDQVERRASEGSRGARPPQFDPDRYCGRNTVERGFGRLRQWRGVATRYDKYARTYLGGVLLAAIVTHARLGLRGIL